MTKLKRLALALLMCAGFIGGLSAAQDANQGQQLPCDVVLRQQAGLFTLCRMGTDTLRLHVLTPEEFVYEFSPNRTRIFRGPDDAGGSATEMMLISSNGVRLFFGAGEAEILVISPFTKATAEFIAALRRVTVALLQAPAGGTSALLASAAYLKVVPTDVEIVNLVPLVPADPFQQDCPTLCRNALSICTASCIKYDGGPECISICVGGYMNCIIACVQGGHFTPPAIE